MATDKPAATPKAEGAQDQSVEVREKLSNRYQDLVKAYNNSNSIAERYDLKIRIEEITAIFELLFR